MERIGTYSPAGFIHCYGEVQMAQFWVATFEMDHPPDDAISRETSPEGVAIGRFTVLVSGATHDIAASMATQYAETFAQMAYWRMVKIEQVPDEITRVINSFGARAT